MAIQIPRRKFVATLGSVVVAWPLAARAQQPAMPVIGFLGSRSPEDSAPLVAGFHAGLGETGFVENRNVTIEFRWAEGHYDRLSGLSAELVSRQVAVIAAPGGIAARLAAKATTAKIPIIFLTGARPGSIRVAQQPQPTGRQCHRRSHPNQHAGPEAVGTAARGGANVYTGGLSRKP